MAETGFSQKFMIHRPPMLKKKKVDIHLIKQVWGLEWASKESQMVTKTVVLMGVRACWAWKFQC